MSFRVSTDAERAHERLMSTLKPRFVPARPAPVITGKTGARTVAQTRILNERIKALIAQGKRNYEIAAELRISAPTVGRHRAGKVKSC